MSIGSLTLLPVTWVIVITLNSIHRYTACFKKNDPISNHYI